MFDHICQHVIHNEENSEVEVWPDLKAGLQLVARDFAVAIRVKRRESGFQILRLVQRGQVQRASQKLLRARKVEQLTSFALRTA